MSNGTGFTQASIEQWLAGKATVEASANASSDHKSISVESNVIIRLAHSTEPGAKDTERKISPEIELSELASIVGQMLRKALSENGDELASDRSGSMSRKYHAVADFQDARNHYIGTGMNGQHQIQKVAHLFHSSEAKMVPVSIVSTARVEPLSTHDSKPLVVDWARPVNYCYLSIGDNKQHFANAADVHQSTSIFQRYFGRCLFGNPRGLELVEVDVAVVNDREIGNFTNTFHVKDLSFGGCLCEPFNQHSTFKELFESVKVHITPLAMGQCAQPSLPASTQLNFSNFVPSIKQGIETQLVSVYGICVNKRDDAETSGLRLSFPIFYELPPRCRPDQLCAKLRLDVLKHFPESRLFGEELAKKWMLCLWVMPQGGTTNTLHCFRDGCLEQYLSATHIAENDRRLYIEAHVVLKEPLARIFAGADISTMDTSDSDGELSSFGSSSMDSILPGCDLIRQPGQSTPLEHSMPLKLYRSPGTAPNPIKPLIAATVTSCLVSMNFRLVMGEEVTIGGRYANVDLRISPEGLRAILRWHSQQFRASPRATEILRELRSQGKGWQMRSYLRFGDDRDEYLHLTDHTPLRFSALSDLFRSKKALRDSPSIEIAVKIEPVADQPCFDSADHTLDYTNFNLHRIGNIRYPPDADHKLREEKAAEHATLINPVVLRYLRNFPDRNERKVAPARPFQGKLLGSSPILSNFGGRKVTLLPKYACISAALHKGVWQMRMSQEAKQEKLPDGVPEWPDLTFLPYVSPPDATMVTEKDVKGATLKLAVRLVNMFPATSRPPLRVPADVLIDFHDGKDATVALASALKKALENEYPEYANTDYEIRFWVLPWKKGVDEDLYAEGLGKVGRLYRWKQGPMRQFVEGEMWKTGERKVWLEAHLAGGKSKHEQAIVHLMGAMPRYQQATVVVLNENDIFSEDSEDSEGEEYASLVDEQGEDKVEAGLEEYGGGQAAVEEEEYGVFV